MTQVATQPPQATSGLRDVVALSSDICSIEDGVLTYRGIVIDELAEFGTFEEIVYLLWYGRLPKLDELAEFKADIAEQAQLPSALIDMMKTFPKRTTPMECLRTAVSAMAIFDPESEDMSPAANERKAVRILAQIAECISVSVAADTRAVNVLALSSWSACRMYALSSARTARGSGAIPRSMYKKLPARLSSRFGGTGSRPLRMRS